MQKNTKVLIAAALSAGLMSSAMHAENKWYDNFNANGFLAGGYTANLNGLTNNGNLKGRVFDQLENQFDGVGGLNITAKGSAGDMGDVMATLELVYGPGFGLVTTDLPVEQAFVSMTHNGWTLKGGKMDTFLGTEVIDAPGNWNYSRSLLFTQIPYYHNGMSIGSSWEGLGWMALVANSVSGGVLPASAAAYTNGILPQSNNSANDSKDLGFQATYSIMGWNWTGGYLFQTITNPYGVAGVYASGHTFNVLTNYQVMEGLNFAAEYLYQTALVSESTVSGLLVNAKRQGYAAYLSYDLGQWVKDLSIAPRFEQWFTPDADPTGVSGNGIATETDEATLSLKYKSGSVTHFLEYRHDFGNDNQFANGVAGSPLYNQDSLTFGGTFSF